MMSVGQEGEKDSPSTTANSIAAAGGGRAKAQCPGLGGCRLKALPALSEKLKKIATRKKISLSSTSVTGGGWLSSFRPFGLDSNYRPN